MHFEGRAGETSWHVRCSIQADVNKSEEGAAINSKRESCRRSKFWRKRCQTHFQTSEGLFLLPFVIAFDLSGNGARHDKSCNASQGRRESMPRRREVSVKVTWVCYEEFPSCGTCHAHLIWVPPGPTWEGCLEGWVGLCGQLWTMGWSGSEVHTFWHKVFNNQADSVPCLCCAGTDGSATQRQSLCDLYHLGPLRDFTELSSPLVLLAS